MGFLSGLAGGLLGGSPSVTTPASGFYSQPKVYQDLYNKVTQNALDLVPQVNTQMFTPMAQTADETKAIQQYQKGFAPTQESLTSDIGMFMNPYNNYVIDPVNKQANSQYSILKQDLNSAGQLGSNRQRLGANDIEQSRLSTIGNLNQQGYSSALNSVLNNLIPQRQQDAQNLMGVGSFQRGLDTETKQAPYAAQQAQLGMLSGIPTQFATAGYPTSTSGGSGASLGGIMSAVSGLASIFSDRRLKQDIEPYGVENGHNVYKFKYIGHPETWIGVMADEVEQKMPEAVTEIDGYKAVDYNKIGVEMRQV